jgi:hypothetical protein
MLAELFGTAFFLFGIAAAIHNKLEDFTAAALIGGSLFWGSSWRQPVEALVF